MTTRTRRQIDAALKGKIALETLRKQVTVTDLAQRYQVHPQIYAWKKQLQDQGARAFESGNDDHAATASARTSRCQDRIAKRDLSKRSAK